MLKAYPPLKYMLIVSFLRKTIPVYLCFFGAKILSGMVKKSQMHTLRDFSPHLLISSSLLIRVCFLRSRRYLSLKNNKQTIFASHRSLFHHPLDVCRCETARSSLKLIIKQLIRVDFDRCNC